MASAIHISKRTGLCDTHPEMKRKQVDLLRSLTPEQRYLKMADLTQSMMELSRSEMRRNNPGLSEEEIRLRFPANQSWKGPGRSRAGVLEGEAVMISGGMRRGFAPGRAGAGRSAGALLRHRLSRQLHPWRCAHDDGC